MYCKTRTTDKTMGRHSRGGQRREETSGEGQLRGGPGSAPAGSDPGPGRGGGRRRCALSPAGVALRRGPQAAERSQGSAGPGPGYSSIYTRRVTGGAPRPASLFPLAPLQVYVLLFLGSPRRKRGDAGFDPGLLPVRSPQPPPSPAKGFCGSCLTTGGESSDISAHSLPGAGPALLNIDGGTIVW